MKYIYEDWKPSQATAVTLVQAAEIMDEYAAAGYSLSLRQLYYQLVSKDYIPNSQREYNRLGRIIGRGRMAGILDWDMIEDRNRTTVKNSHWNSPKGILRSAARSFQINKWEDQPYHIEVMVEKDALSGVLEPVCADLDVRFTANKGYSSISHLYRVGRRINEMVETHGKNVLILYLGDFDPSGLDMDRDIFERLELFSEQSIDLDRLALTTPQIDQYNPPPNPAKMTDSRAAVYVEQYGGKSWELDALDPNVLADLVKNAVAEVRDDELMNEAEEREEEMRSYLDEVADNYEGA